MRGTLTSEARVEAAFRNLVLSLGGIAIKIYAARGEPDRIALFPGRSIVFVELKKPKEKPKPHQLRAHARLRRMGFPVLVFDGRDWKKLHTQLEICCSIGGVVNQRRNRWNSTSRKQRFMPLHVHSAMMT